MFTVLISFLINEGKKMFLLWFRNIRPSCSYLSHIKRTMFVFLCDRTIDREPNVRILQNTVTLESERYTADFLYIECLNIA